jgi:hypothetical protein
MKDAAAPTLANVKREKWKELCALAAVEQDTKRLIELAEEISRLLEEMDKASGKVQ